MNVEEAAFRQRLQRVESLIERLEQIADPDACGAARELVQTLLELHYAGMARMLDLAGSAEIARGLLDTWVADPLVRSLLLLHGLHPVDLEQRARAAVEGLRPRLQARGADVDLLSVTEGVVHLRVQDARCTVPIEDLHRLIEVTLGEEVPDLQGIAFAGPLSLRVSLPLIEPSPPG
jgi:hypothetical protein